MTLTIPLKEFIEELQRKHAELGNHPSVGLTVSNGPNRGQPEIYTGVGHSTGFGSSLPTIHATCFK